MDNYGLNFGFRWLDDNRARKEARLRTPAAGGPFQQGSLVEYDAANPGFMKLAPASAPMVPGVCGLLVSEEVWIRSIYEADREGLDTFQIGVVKPNQQAQVVNGSGSKIWLRNSVAQTRADGRVIAAVQVVTGLATAVVGSSVLVWDGGKYVASAAGTAGGVATVTYVSGAPDQPTADASGYCEAVLLV
jgi:hypothetical protein